MAQKQTAGECPVSCFGGKLFACNCLIFRRVESRALETKNSGVESCLIGFGDAVVCKNKGITLQANKVRKVGSQNADAGRLRQDGTGVRVRLPPPVARRSAGFVRKTGVGPPTERNK
jgi:hypothetical protein